MARVISLGSVLDRSGFFRSPGLHFRVSPLRSSALADDAVVLDLAGVLLDLLVGSLVVPSPVPIDREESIGDLLNGLPLDGRPAPCRRARAS
jgi:hypothetical protein